ncbi:hypothetical protein ABZP36_008260 [Zizania latifolia]
MDPRRVVVPSLPPPSATATTSALSAHAHPPYPFPPHLPLHLRTAAAPGGLASQPRATDGEIPPRDLRSTPVTAAAACYPIGDATDGNPTHFSAFSLLTLIHVQPTLQLLYKRRLLYSNFQPRFKVNDTERSQSKRGGRRPQVPGKSDMEMEAHA